MLKLPNVAASHLHDLGSPNIRGDIVQLRLCPETSFLHFRRNEATMKGPPRRSGSILRAQSQGPNQKRKPPTKTKHTRFDALVARYYCSIYSLVLQITDDPLEAVLLTHHAFKSMRKQLRSRGDEAIIVTMLVAAVIQGLNARGFN